MPEDLVLSPPRAVTEAQRLLDDGMPFHAHEILEAVWKSAPETERDLWQGLAQLAVGLTHWLRGNPTGAAALLRRGQERIVPYADDPPYGVDVPAVVQWAQDALGALARGGDDVPPPHPPRLRSSAEPLD